MCVFSELPAMPWQSALEALEVEAWHISAKFGQGNFSSLLSIWLEDRKDSCLSINGFTQPMTINGKKVFGLFIFSEKKPWKQNILLRFVNFWAQLYLQLQYTFQSKGVWLKCLNIIIIAEFCELLCCDEPSWICCRWAHLSMAGGHVTSVYFSTDTLFLDSANLFERPFIVIWSRRTDCWPLRRLCSRCGRCSGCTASGNMARAHLQALKLQSPWQGRVVNSCRRRCCRRKNNWRLR